MATTTEEVLVRVGVDHSSVREQLIAAKAKFGSFGKEIKATSEATTAETITTSTGIIERQFHRTIGTLKNLLRVNLASMALQFISWWKQVGAQMTAEKIYGIDKLTANDEVMEAQRKRLERFHAQNAEQVKTMRKDWEKAMEYSYDRWKEKEGEKSEKVLKAEIRGAEAGLKRAEQIAKEAQKKKDALAYSKAEADVELWKLNVLKAQNDLRDAMADKRAKEIAKQNELNKPRVQKLQELMGSGAFAGEISEIQSLYTDAALAAKYPGNEAARQRRSTDLRIASDKLRALEQKLNTQITPTPKPEDKIIQQIFDALAPIKNPDGSLKVTVTNVE